MSEENNTESSFPVDRSENKKESSDCAAKNYPETSNPSENLVRSSASNLSNDKIGKAIDQNRELDPSIVESHVKGEATLRFIIKYAKSGISKTTLSRKINDYIVKNIPGWYQLTKLKKDEGIWKGVMGIDSTGIKAGGKNYVFILVFDIPSGDPLAYVLCRNKDAATVKSILRQLKELEYEPKIVVLDLAPELLKSAAEVYPLALIQGCIWHADDLAEKQLPTKKMTKKVDQDRIILYDEIKELMHYGCVAANQEVRLQVVQKLKRLASEDEKAERAVDLFIKRLKYFNTLDQEVLATALKEFGGSILYNNCCENGMGLIKRLKRKMNGFKNLASAINLINARMFYFRQDSKSPSEKDSFVIPAEEPISIFTLPLNFFYEDPLDLVKLSKATGLSKEELGEKAEEMAFEVIGDYAYSKNKLIDLQITILKEINKAVQQIIVQTRCNYEAIIKPMDISGFKIKNKSLFNPTKITQTKEKLLHETSEYKKPKKEKYLKLKKFQKIDEFVEKDGILADRDGFCVIFKNENNETIERMINCAALNTPPFLFLDEIPLKALQRIKDERNEPDVKVGESYYDSALVAKVLKITGNTNVSFYQLGKNQPLGIKTSTYRAIIAPRAVSVSNKKSEIEEAEKIVAIIPTLQRIILNHKNGLKIDAPIFSLSAWGKSTK